MPRASTAVFNAWVPEPTHTLVLTPINLANSFSNLNTVPLGDCILHQIPLRVVFTISSTTFSSTYGQSGHIFAGATGVPPRIASLPVLLFTMVMLPNDGIALATATAAVPADTVVIN